MNRAGFAKKVCEHGQGFLLLHYKYTIMTWKEVFEGIQSITEDILFLPFDALRFADSWFLSNIVSWILMVIGFVAFIYWMGQLKKFNDNNEEDRSQTSHSYLG
jgi:hypothetical protein